MSLFSWARTTDPTKRADLQRKRLADSETFLIDAAVAIADVANALRDQLKRRLEDADVQFEGTANILDDALLLCDMNGIIQHANPAAHRDFGTGLVGRPVIELFVSDEPIVSPTCLFEMLQDPVRTAARIHGRGPDGTPFVIEPKLERLDWQDRTSSMIILIARDRAATIKTIIDICFDGILVVQDDFIVAANPSISQIFGYETAALLGHPLSNLFPNEQAERINDNSLTKSQYVIGTHDNGEAINLVYATTSILWGSESARVVTVKRVSAFETQDLNIDLRTENGVDMIVCVDPLGKITFANSTFARVYGKTRADLVTSNIKDILTAAELEIFYANIAQLSIDNPTLRVQLQHQREGQPTAIHDWIWHVVFDDKGIPIEYQRTGRDISSVVANIVTSGYF